jgi:hypothetical protein
MPGTDAPTYAGTFLNPAQKRRIAYEVSAGERVLPIPLDHAGYGIGDADKLVPPEQALGYWTDAWVDGRNDLYALGEFDADRHDVQLLLSSLKRRHAYNERLRRGEPGLRPGETAPPPMWGVSVFTPYIKEVATARAVAHNPTHIGATPMPELAEEGSYILEFSESEDAIRRILHDKYWATDAQAYVPGPSRAAWSSSAATPQGPLALGGKHSGLAPGHQLGVVAASATSLGPPGSSPSLASAMDVLMALEAAPRPNSSSLATLFAPIHRRIMADVSAPASPPAAAAAPPPAAAPVPVAPAAPVSALPTPVPTRPTPSLDERLHNNTMFLAASHDVLKRKDLAAAATDAQRLLKRMQEEQHMYDITDPRFGEIHDSMRKMRDLINGVDQQSRMFVSELQKQGAISAEHASVFSQMAEEAMRVPDDQGLARYNTLLVAAAASGALRQKEAERALLEKQQLLALQQKSEREAAEREEKMKKDFEEREQTLKRRITESETEAEATKRRYVELQQSIVPSSPATSGAAAAAAAAGSAVMSPTAAAVKTVDAVVAAGAAGQAGAAALSAEEARRRGAFADRSMVLSFLDRMRAKSPYVSETTNKEYLQQVVGEKYVTTKILRPWNFQSTSD